MKQMINCIIQTILLLGILITEIKGECIKLTSSKSCPKFADYYIDTTNGIFPLTSLPKYTDLASFDNYINKYSDVLARNYTASLIKESTCSVQQIQEMEDFAIKNLRYITTFACNFIIISDNNKCNKSKSFVCKDDCNFFFSSFEGFARGYQKNFQCINQNVMNSVLEVHSNRCISANSYFSGVQDQNHTCITGNENNCGFKYDEGLTNYCNRYSDDGTCCYQKKLSQTVIDVTPTSQQSSISEVSDNAEVDNADSNLQQNQNIVKNTSKLWIIISVACGLLVISALVYFYKKGESLDSENKSYNDENQFPPFQSNERGISPNMYSQNSNGYNGNKMNFNTNDVLINRNEMNMKMNEPIIDDFKFKDENFNYTSNYPITNDNGFGNTDLYAGMKTNGMSPLGMGPTGMGAIGMGAAAIGAAGLGTTTTFNNMNAVKKEKDIPIPKPQMVNMTNIEPPKTQAPNQTPEIKIDEVPKPQMVNMTSIRPPESQEPNSPSLIKVDEEPKPQMVNMTEIPEPEMQLNRNTKFLSSYSEAPSNQHISSQFYGESEEPSFDFTNSKLELPKTANKTVSMTSSALFSNRSSTDKELNSTPYIAIHTYEPQLNDELLLEINDIIEVVYVYDDGWVWGVNTRTNDSGACPMLCLEKIEGEADDFSIDERMKSVLSARDNSMISRDSVPGRRDSILNLSMSNM